MTMRFSNSGKSIRNLALATALAGGKLQFASDAGFSSILVEWDLSASVPVINADGSYTLLYNNATSTVAIGGLAAYGRMITGLAIPLVDFTITGASGGGDLIIGNPNLILGQEITLIDTQFFHGL